MDFFNSYPSSYWELISRMANYIQLMTFMMEMNDVKNSNLAAMLGEQNQNYLEILSVPI